MRPFEVIFDLEAQGARLAQLDKDMTKPGFWDDAEKAREVTTERTRLAKRREVWASLEKELEEIEIVHDLALEEEDEETAS